jgi:DNA-binding IclR family transcriptional regulator
MSSPNDANLSKSDVGRPDRPSYAVPALDKALDVFEELAARGGALTQAEIARATGRTPNELFRVLTALERRGYLLRDPANGAYSLSLRLFELSRMHSPFETLLTAAARPMRELTGKLRESCHLGVLRGGDVLVIAAEESPARVRLSIGVGSTIAAKRSASGRLLLAHGPADGDQRLATIRERGYEDARGETVDGVSDLAAFIGSDRSRVKAALAVTALARDHEAFVARCLPHLLATTAEITQTAGLAFGDDRDD